MPQPPTRSSSSARPATLPTSRSSPAARPGARRGPERADHRRRQGGWGLEQLKARAKDSLQQHGRSDEAPSRSCCQPAALCRWRLRRPGDLRRTAAGSSATRNGRCIIWRSRPACSASSPPALAEVGLSERRPAGRSKSPSATTAPRRRSSTGSCCRTSPRRTSSASTTSWARSRSRTCSTRASPTRCSSRSGTATTCAASRSPWRKPSASRIAARSMTRPAHSATSAEPLLQVLAQSVMDPPTGEETRRCATRKQVC